MHRSVSAPRLPSKIPGGIEDGDSYPVSSAIAPGSGGLPRSYPVDLVASRGSESSPSPFGSVVLEPVVMPGDGASSAASSSDSSPSGVVDSSDKVDDTSSASLGAIFPGSSTWGGLAGGVGGVSGTKSKSLKPSVSLAPYPSSGLWSYDTAGSSSGSTVRSSLSASSLSSTTFSSWRSPEIVSKPSTFVSKGPSLPKAPAASPALSSTAWSSFKVSTSHPSLAGTKKPPGDFTPAVGSAPSSKVGFSMSGKSKASSKPEEEGEKVMKPVSLSGAIASATADEVEVFLSNKYVNSEINTILERLQPSHESETVRGTILKFIESLIRRNLGAKLFAHGSFALKTYLPDSDMNISAFFTHNHQRTWVQRAIKSLLREDHATEAVASAVPFSPTTGSPELADSLIVQSATFENSLFLGRVISAVVGDMKVEICANQSHTLASIAMFEEVDRLVGKDHLFKRSVILTKAWALYETKILGNAEGFVNSYSFHCLMLFIFNAFSKEIETPLQALWKLLDYCTRFDWEKHVFTAYGPILLSAIPSIRRVMDGPSAWPKGVEPLFPPSLLLRYRGDGKAAAIAATTGASSFLSDEKDPIVASLTSETFEKKFFHIMDPRDPNNNLGAHISRTQAIMIRQAFAYCSKQLKKAVSLWMATRHTKKAVALIFENSIKRIARLPPPTTVSSGSGPKSIDDETGFPGSTELNRLLDGNLAVLVQQMLNAAEFDVPDISEEDLVNLMKEILQQNGGVVTVGKMGSLMHAATNNHSLPATLKVKYGGLKKLLRRHADVFYVANDHPHNPRVYLRDAMSLPAMSATSGAGYEDVPSFLSSSLTTSSSSPHLFGDGGGRVTTGIIGSSSIRIEDSRPRGLTVGSASSLPSSPSQSPKHSKGESLLTASSSSPSLYILDDLNPTPSTSVSGDKDRISDPADKSSEDMETGFLPSFLTGTTPPKDEFPAPKPPKTKEVPGAFLCPISKKIMRDPVVTAEGDTYDRRSIESWRREHGDVSPSSGNALDLSVVFPNNILRRMVAEYLQGSFTVSFSSS